VSKLKVQANPKATSPLQVEPVQSISANVFTDDEIRARAFQIYESGDRNNNTPDEDWSQAQTELTELLGGK
jgi:hypothetical protein